MNYKNVLDFWFKNPGKWWVKDPAFDAEIEEKFGDAVIKASAGDFNDWANEPESCLALIILLDQFSRNIYRDSPQAFAADGLALNFAKKAVQNGFDKHLKDDQHMFLYMPFMHSEQMDDQMRCIELFTTNGPQQNVGFAWKHQDIIKRFGRFPHRNAALGRVNTPEEQAFLQTPGSGF